MLKRMLAIAVVLAVAGGGAFGAYWSEDPVTVPVLQRTVTGYALGGGVTLDWNIVPVTSGTYQGNYGYTYTWSSAPTSWTLEVSPGAPSSSFGFVGNYTATIQDYVDITGINTNVIPAPWGPENNTLNTAITFSPTAGTTSFTFYTQLGPVYGDVFGSVSTTVYSPWLGVPTDDSMDTPQLANYIPMPDGSFGDYPPVTIIPEPSLSVLALTALLAGAVARRRKKETEV